jgi:methyl-accepting chemotaxis protein
MSSAPPPARRASSPSTRQSRPPPGEAGEGLAVVAGEVKKLADETAKATVGIKENIAAIRKDTDSAALVISRISEIISIIDTLEGTLAAAMADQSTTTDKITRTMLAAADASAGITDTVHGVAGSARVTPRGSETEHAAGERTRIAAELQELVTRFAV